LLHPSSRAVTKNTARQKTRRSLSSVSESAENRDVVVCCSRGKPELVIYSRTIAKTTGIPSANLYCSVLYCHNVRDKPRDNKTEKTQESSLGSRRNETSPFGRHRHDDEAYSRIRENLIASRATASPTHPGVALRWSGLLHAYCTSMEEKALVSKCIFPI
jgi:hypothetical protein